MKENLKNFGKKVFKVLRDFLNISLKVTVTTTVTSKRELIDNNSFLIDYDTMKDNSFKVFKSKNNEEIAEYDNQLDNFFKRHGDYIKNLDIKFVKDTRFLDDYDEVRYVQYFKIGDITSDTHIRLVLSNMSHLHKIRLSKHLYHISENGKWNENSELEELEVYRYSVIIMGVLEDDEFYSV